MDDGPLRGRPWSARKHEAARVRRAAGPNREVGLVFGGVPDGAGGEWVTVEWSGWSEYGRPIRPTRKQHRPDALEWLD